MMTLQPILPAPAEPARTATGGNEVALLAAANSAYHHAGYPARPCDYCGANYTGPAVYCSLACARADA
jgi:hypothetical protein